MKYFAARLFSLLVLIEIFSFSLAFGQDSIPGYILDIRDNRIYLDFKSGDVSVGEKLQVIKEGGYFTHPVTGNKIQEDDETIAVLEIIDVKTNYSIATVYPQEAINNLQKGTKVFQITGKNQVNGTSSGIFKKSIAVQPLTVLNVQGYLGIYICDVLTEQLLSNDVFRILDRQTLGLQDDQIFLSSGGVLTDTELQRYSAQNGADYYISGTMYEPDVVELSTGMPVKNIVGLVGHAAEAATGKDLKVDKITEFVPDKIEIKRLKAVVKISLRVVDVKTGEIKFLCTEMQQVEGESDINLEGGLLGGLKIRGGVTSFQNTITGKATQMALKNLTGYIIDHFNGNITEKTYSGNVIEISELDKRVQLNEIHITNVIKMPVSIMKGGILNKDTTYFVTLNHGQDFKIWRNSYLRVYSPSMENSVVTGEEHAGKNRIIGHIGIVSTFSKTSEGKLFFTQSYNKAQFDPEKSFAKIKRIRYSAYLLTAINIYKNDDLSDNYGGYYSNFRGLGVMVYGGRLGLGAYGQVGLMKWEYRGSSGKIYSNNQCYLGYGLTKTLGPKTNLSIGSTASWVPEGSYDELLFYLFNSIELLFNTRVGKNFSIFYGCSFDLGENLAFIIPVGIGFVF